MGQCHNLGVDTVKMQSGAITTRIPCEAFYGCTHLPHPSPHPHAYPLATTHLFSISIIVSFQDCSINRIIQYVTFWDWLFFSVNIISLRFIQVVVCISNLFFLLLHSIPLHRRITV